MLVIRWSACSKPESERACLRRAVPRGERVRLRGASRRGWVDAALYAELNPPAPIGYKIYVHSHQNRTGLCKQPEVAPDV